MDSDDFCKIIQIAFRVNESYHYFSTWKNWLLETKKPLLFPFGILVFERLLRIRYITSFVHWLKVVYGR